MSLASHLFSAADATLPFHVKVIPGMMRLHNFGRSALPFHAELCLAGVRCVVSTNAQEVLACVSQRFSAQGFPIPSGPPISLEILVEPSIRHDPSAKAHFRGLRHLVFATFGVHEVFAFDMLRRRVTGAICPTTAGNSSFWNTRLLPIMVGVMGTTVGVVPLHSACLDRDGKGLLIAGLSGAGKSTLSVALAQREFSLVSDDWTYVSKDGSKEGVIASGLSAPVKLLPDAVRHFPELKDLIPKESLNGELAFEVDATKIFRSQVKCVSRPHWLMFLERDDKPGCEFTPFSPADARAFYERSAEHLPQELPEAAEKRSEIIRMVASRECVHVRSGESPQKTAAAIDRFCSGAQRVHQR
jgi:hypothetical protein